MKQELSKLQKPLNGNLFVKSSAVLYWLIGIAIAAMAIAVSFHFDDSVREFMMQHQNPAMRNFMRYVSLFGDWPSHTAVGLVLLGLAWRRGSEEWTRIFLAMLLAMMLAGVAGTVIKRTVPRARPSCTPTHAGAVRASARNITRFHPDMLAPRPRSLEFYLSLVGASVLLASLSRF